MNWNAAVRKEETEKWLHIRPERYWHHRPSDIKNVLFECISTRQQWQALPLLLPRVCCPSCRLFPDTRCTEGNPATCEQVFHQDHVPTQEMGAYHSFHRHANVATLLRANALYSSSTITLHWHPVPLSADAWKVLFCSGHWIDILQTPEFIFGYALLLFL